MGDHLDIIILGCGASTGVPVPTCDCNVCTCVNPKNNRTRSSILIKNEQTTIVIDTTPDFRFQILDKNVKNIDAILYTHAHADHIFGIDDLRLFSYKKKDPILLYTDKSCCEELHDAFKYIFSPDLERCIAPPPRLQTKEIFPKTAFNIGSMQIIPLRLFHGSLPILGFRIGSMAYLTDCSEIPSESMQLLDDLDLLIITGLRERLHKTHFSISQAIKIIETLKPKEAYLTHLSHEVEYQSLLLSLPQRTTIPTFPAYDNLQLKSFSNLNPVFRQALKT